MFETSKLQVGGSQGKLSKGYESYLNEMTN